MKTLKRIYKEEWVETQSHDLRWAVVSLAFKSVPEYVMAAFETKSTAEFFVDSILKNYSKDKEWFEVREIQVEL